MKRWESCEARLELALGDHTTETTDAIVNPVGAGLVDLAVRRAAGPDLLDAYHLAAATLPGWMAPGRPGARHAGVSTGRPPRHSHPDPGLCRRSGARPARARRLLRRVAPTGHRERISLDSLPRHRHGRLPVPGGGGGGDRGGRPAGGRARGAAPAVVRFVFCSRSRCSLRPRGASSASARLRASAVRPSRPSWRPESAVLRRRGGR